MKLLVGLRETIGVSIENKQVKVTDGSNIIGEYCNRRCESLWYRELDTDPTLRSLNESFQKKFGTTTTQEGINRDNRADKQAIPTIRQIFGNSLSDRTKKAMTKLERGN